ncbi:hypothetical protein FFZ96_14860 [Leptospira borgpetersenii]|nr:hypothetical protein LBHB_13120 [Leptospira borgpetersenii serovar Hardjo]TQE53620.1 hypothetical protein FFZ96_14860 [Leptospira borgpetersenii]
MFLGQFIGFQMDLLLEHSRRSSYIRGFGTSSKSYKVRIGFPKGKTFGLICGVFSCALMKNFRIILFI